MGIIYLRTNTVNGMQYVGQTKNIDKRNASWKNLKKNYSNPFISEERRKYGLDSFSFAILKECDDSEMDDLERYYIKTLNTRYPNGYNMCDGGKGCSGWIMPEKNKQNLSEKRKGGNNPMFGVKPWNTGKEWSDENKKKISDGLKGKMKGVPKSEEHKRKIGLAHSKPVIQILPDGTAKEWESAADAGRNGFNFSHICACCRGERNKHKGSKWVYKDEYEKMLGN